MPDNAEPKRPTIDERICAVVQSLELTAAMQRDNERRFDIRFGPILDGLERLSHIAEIHERRISHLEGDQP
jgi:hypothetical protein